MSEATENQEVTTETAIEAPVETPEGKVVETQVEAQPFLSAELLEQGNLKNFKTPDDLAKSYLHAQKMLGGSIRIPGEDATEEDIKVFKEKISKIEGVVTLDDPEAEYKLGKPRSPEDYLINVPTEHLTEDLIDSLNAFREEAFELGMSQKHVRALGEKRVQELIEMRTQQGLELKAAEEALQKDWGHAYESEMSNARKVLAIFKSRDPESFEKLMEHSGRNPLVMKMAAELAKVYSEKQHVGFSEAKFAVTREAAQRELNEMRNDPKKMEILYNRNAKGHAELVQKRAELQRIAAGE